MKQAAALAASTVCCGVHLGLIAGTSDGQPPELAGFGGGRLYAGSWSQYGADPDRPIAAG